MIMQSKAYILSVMFLYIKMKAGILPRVCAAVLLPAACTALMVFSENCKEGVSQGIELCFKVLVPSLFPFMVVINLLIKTGVCARAGKRLTKPAQALFGINGSFAPVLLLSLIGGYPVGASGISELYQSGALSEKEAKKAAMYAVCAGPGFMISFVGQSIYRNAKIGAVILSAQILSVFVLGIVLKFTCKTEQTTPQKAISVPSLPFSHAMVESVYAASRSMLSICGFVVTFSAVIGMIDSGISNQHIKVFLYPLLEVCNAVTKLSPDCSVELIAFALGFGGICVHFQIFAALDNIRIHFLPFFMLRVVQGLLTALLTHAGLKLLFDKVQVFSTHRAGNADIFGGSILSGAMLIGVSICFLVSFKSYQSKN